MNTSTSGHWCVQPSFPLDAVDVLFTTKGMTGNDKRNAARRLHRQFCHPPYEFLRKVLSSLDECDREFLYHLKAISQECMVCKRYKPTNSRPAVGNLFDPEKLQFNQVVSIDLKERNGRYILYIIDIVTRYTRAQFIKNKRQQTIVNKIIELWLSVFGSPAVFYADNGREFANEEMQEFGEQYGIVIKHTPAYS